MIPRTPLYTVHFEDAESAMRGFLVVHSAYQGASSGGVRVAPDVSLEEVGHLARAMTYKYAFWNRPSGGAKAGVLLPAGLDADARRRAFTAVGRCLAPLLQQGLYSPWPDLNCGPADVQAIYRGAGLTAGALPDSSEYTACTVFGGVIAAAQHLGLAPRDCRVSIEGLGKVGSRLAQEVAQWGGTVVAASTVCGAVAHPAGLDVPSLLAARRQHGDAFVLQPGPWEQLPCDALFSLPTDLLVPCARVGAVDADVAASLSAQAVVPGANVPYAGDAEAILASRGLLTLPDFVTNSGGIVGTRLVQLGVSPAEVRTLLIDELAAMLGRGLTLSTSRGLSPLALAREVAEARFASRRESPRGGLPRAISRRLARRLPRSVRRWQALTEFLRLTRTTFAD